MVCGQVSLKAQVEAALASAANMPKAENYHPHAASDGLQNQKIATFIAKLLRI